MTTNVFGASGRLEPRHFVASLVGKAAEYVKAKQLGKRTPFSRASADGCAYGVTSNAMPGVGHAAVTREKVVP